MASKSPLKKYTEYLMYAGVILAIGSSLGQYFWGDARVHKLWFLILLFMVTVQWLVFAFTVKFGQHKTSTMLKQYQIAKYAKLLLFMVFLVVTVFAMKLKFPVAFLTNFIVYYLVFTVLEAWSIHRWMNALPRTPDK